MKAKTTSLLILFFVTGIGISLAQENEITIRKSIKGGVVASSFDNSTLETGPRPGFALGLAFDFRLHSRFSLHPEITYIEKGGSVTSPLLDTEFVLNMDYIEFPVLARYYFPRSGPAEPHISAGPYVKALIANSSSTEVMEEGLFTPDDLVEEARQTGWGVSAGIGSVFHFPFNEVTAELRYGRTLSAAFEPSSGDESVLQYMSLLIGFSF